MKKFLIILPLILLAGCEYRYRYECQDPANWGKESCNNDVCKAEGDCASDVLGFTPKVGEKFKNGTVDANIAPTSGENLSTEGSQEISNKTGVDCKNVEKPKFKPYNATVQQNTFKRSLQENNAKPVVQEIIGQIEEAVERPLTMNTIVETSGHNNAAKFNKW